MDGATIPLLPVALIYVLALSVLVRRRARGLGSGQLVLAILPICLLFIVASVPFSAAALILAFQRVAGQGTGGLAVVGPFCVAMTSALRLGLAACLVALTAAATVQAFAPDDTPVPTTPGRGDGGAWWRTLILAAAPVLIAPVIWLSHMARGIPVLVMRACDPSSAFAPEVMRQMSVTVSRDLVLAVGVGALTIVALTGASAATVFTARSGTASDRLTRYAWALLAMTLAWGLWLVVLLSRDLRAFQLALR